MSHGVRASLLAPLTAPALYCFGTLAAALIDPARRGSAFQDLGSGITVVFLFGSPIAYAASFGAALPALWLLRRAGPLTWLTVVLVGLAVGAGTAAILGPPLKGELISVPLAPWHGAVLGGAAAGVWYRLARLDRSRPAR